MGKPDKRRLAVQFDDYTLLLEEAYINQCLKNGQTKPNRSHIIRNLYQDYLKKNIIAKDPEK